LLVVEAVEAQTLAAVVVQVAIELAQDLVLQKAQKLRLRLAPEALVEPLVEAIRVLQAPILSFQQLRLRVEVPVVLVAERHQMAEAVVLEAALVAM
jgi:hypothetical protein